MAIHTELRPDDASLPLLLADAALRQSNANVTRISGMLSVDNGDGSETWIGGNVNSDSDGGVTEWVGDTTVPGKPTGLSAVSAVNRVLVSWNGTLHGGVPADFDHISVFAVDAGTVESLGDLNCAGTILSKKYAEGTILEVYAVAYDAARDEQGNHSPNMSEESDRITLVVEQDVDMGQLNDAAADMEQKADEAAAKADQVRSDLQAEVDKVSAKADDLGKTGDQLAGQITDIKGTVNGQQTKLTEFGQKLEGEITRGDTTVKSVTELKQTVNGLSSTVSQTTKTASAALSKATSVEQTANGLKATISKDYQTTKQADGKYSTKTELSATADGIRADLTETSKTANGAMDKATSLESTADGLSARISETAKTLDSTITTVNQVKSTADSNTKTVSQVADTADGLSKRTSSLEQNLNGFKREVSQTYTPRTDFDGLTIGGTNLLVNSDFSQGLANWVPELQTNGVGTVTADKLSGFDFANTMCTINVTEPTTGLCRIYQLRNPNPMRTDMVDTVSFWAKASVDTSLLVGRMDDQHWTRIGTKWKRYTLTVQKWNGSNAFCVAVGANFTGTVKVTKLMWEHASKPSAWSPAPEDMQRAGDYSTKSYVDQKSKSIALGVVQNYKGADGSGLATKSDITVEHERITSEVSGKYATKDGVTEEISSKVTQNNESLDVKFATKAENQSTLDTANTAQSNASDAQSRVGTLEDCISLTSAGVRAGHQSNGVFDGVSALVNTDGSFDLLDKDGNLLTRINRHRFQVTGDDGVGGGYLSLSQDGINITVQPTADTSKTYHIQLGKSGVGITAPDGSGIGCSASGGLNIETVKYGKISIGAGGLQFTNDQGWGLKLSAAGWYLKWAGNHTLATGPAAGKLYIDGREIVTR
ncbi:hypothetical protein [Bifidobacterium adolescentis]|uniref:Autotransporter adhesin n=1 Tax=Bifidobacterium adolescentis TaxID=1680 RepID=A0AAF1A4X3_BIFAD|nr:hypothetical protein [Bifidobacterium adolescentis]WNE84518.1 hypothetical protein B0703_05745 [Bifidobacterium adolescentis]WNE86189.1 hypothetical protein B0703_04620 [Bifidobacterium adolescentis]